MNWRWRWRLGAWTHSLRCTKVGIVVKHPHCATRHTALRRRSSVRLLRPLLRSRLQDPSGSIFSPGVPRSADDLPGARPRISGRRSRPLLVRIRRDDVRFRATQPGRFDDRHLTCPRLKQHLQRFHAELLHGGVFLYGEQPQPPVHRRLQPEPQTLARRYRLRCSAGAGRTAEG